MPPTAALMHAKPANFKAIIDDIELQFDLDEDSLNTITNKFLDDFNLGLGKYGEAMAMIPTFVTSVPDGTETGTFLALDLGGTNLRVCEVTLNGDKTFSLRQQKYKVSDELKTGEATVLFDYLADSVDAFLTSSSLSPTSPTGLSSAEATAIPLGLTFSFPVEQTALDEGKILTWTKGFAAKNAIGNDVVKLLQDAFDRKHLHVKCVALVNDTVGALLSRAYQSGGCILGAIFGTGTNGAYVEQVKNITKLNNSPVAAKGGEMIVNTEWGAFNNSRTILPSTPFDNKLDRESINPRYQAFEKFISGMYLGEITRNILLSLIDSAPHPILFSGKASKVMNTHYGFDTEFMSLIETSWESEKEPGPPEEKKLVNGNGVIDDDESLLDFSKPLTPETVKPATLHKLESVKDVLVNKVGYLAEDVSLRDAAIVRWACAIVGKRAAKLSGVAVATVVKQMGLEHRLKEEIAHGGGRISVGVDGSLIQHYPRFEETMRLSLKALIGEELESKVEIGLAKDGSGVGAALCALVATKETLTTKAALHS